MEAGIHMPSLDHRPNPNKQLITDYFADVFGARNPDAVSDYVAPDLIQHGADIPDGAAALTEFLRMKFGREQAEKGAPTGTPGLLEPVFIVAEKDLVAVCHYMPQQDPAVPDAYFDYYSFNTYRIRGGRITERWPSINKVAPPRVPAPGTPSRAVAVSSSPDIDLDANKRLVVDFYRCVFDAQNPDAVKDFVTEDYQQHVSFYPDHRTGLEHAVRTMFPNGPVPTPPEPLNPPAVLLAEGDIVVAAGLLPQPEPDGSGATYPYYAYDAYRVRGKMLAEHWSGITKAAPPKHP